MELLPTFGRFKNMIHLQMHIPANKIKLKRQLQFTYFHVRYFHRDFTYVTGREIHSLHIKNLIVKLIFG
jgi:hypothetical protein